MAVYSVVVDLVVAVVVEARIVYVGYLYLLEVGLVTCVLIVERRKKEGVVLLAMIACYSKTLYTLEQSLPKKKLKLPFTKSFVAAS